MKIFVQREEIDRGDLRSHFAEIFNGVLGFIL